MSSILICSQFDLQDPYFEKNQFGELRDLILGMLDTLNYEKVCDPIFECDLMNEMMDRRTVRKALAIELQTLLTTSADLERRSEFEQLLRVGRASAHSFSARATRSSSGPRCAACRLSLAADQPDQPDQLLVIFKFLLSYFPTFYTHFSSFFLLFANLQSHLVCFFHPKVIPLEPF